MCNNMLQIAKTNWIPYEACVHFAGSGTGCSASTGSLLTCRLERLWGGAERVPDSQVMWFTWAAWPGASSTLFILITKTSG